MHNDSPCPFCGCKHTRDFEVGKRFWVGCPRCGCLGPNKDNLPDARKVWNKRGRKKEAQP